MPSVKYITPSAARSSLRCARWSGFVELGLRYAGTDPPTYTLDCQMPTLQQEDQPGPEFASKCEALMRALPEWFGIESALMDYVRDIAEMPTWLWVEGESIQGFLTIKRHFQTAAEIHVMAVSPDAHRTGIGRKLLNACEQFLREEGCQFLQVKTLSANSPDSNYEKTRLFYTSVGFAPLQEFPTLWDEWNPCLLLIKTL